MAPHDHEHMFGMLAVDADHHFDFTAEEHSE
jgi:hypothetical protein